MRPLNVLGLVICIVALGLWMIGGNYVGNQYWKRFRGPKPLRGERLSIFFNLRKLNDRERRLLALIGIVAFALGVIGLVLLNGVP